MKVHLVFSLNLTGSFADDIIHVFSSVRYRLYGKLLANKILEIFRHRIRDGPLEIYGGGGGGRAKYKKKIRASEN